MTVNDFLCIARKEISEDPVTRVHPKTQLAVEASDCIFDVHCHIFDNQCLSIPYIALRMARSGIVSSLGLESMDDLDDKLDILKKSDKELYRLIEAKRGDTKKEWGQLDTEMKALDEHLKQFEDLESLSLFGLGDAWRVLKKGLMSEVFDFYQKQFAISNLPQFKNRPFVTAILMMDLETGWRIQPEKKFYQQIEELQKLILEHCPKL